MEVVREYSPGEYCADIGCKHYHGGAFDESCNSCSAYDYYRWLKEHNFRLLEVRADERATPRREMVNRQQLGRFRIATQLIDEDPQQVADIFGLLQCVVVWANPSHDTSEIEYIGISPRFERVPRGYVVPEYLLRVTTSEAGNVELVQVSLGSAETSED